MRFSLVNKFGSKSFNDQLLIRTQHGLVPTAKAEKLAEPVKRIIGGADVADVASRDALVDPAAIEPFVAYARERAARA